MMKFLNKKGDLNLSINAIVILIIAIVFLGLALTFTRNIILGSSSKLLTQVDMADFSNPATADTIMTFDSQLTFKASETKTIKMSVYNKNSDSTNEAQVQITDCQPTGGISSSNLIVTSVKTKIDGNSQKSFPIIVATKGAKVDSYICTVKFDTIEKQVALTINQ